MQQRQKCCAHCPGNWASNSGRSRENHTCCLPTYVRGNLKLSSLAKVRPGDAKRSERLRGNVRNATKDEERPSSCYDRFAIAKKFHAENLQHQPLPDRVDDSIFKNAPMTSSPEDSGDDPKKRASDLEPREGRRKKYLQTIRAGLQYGPTLGCKTPTTNMDLAICWEAPLDPTYEPSRAIHIDGTDGGPAPAVFALVEHEIPRREDHRANGKCATNPVEIYEAKFANLRNRCRCNFAKTKETSGALETNNNNCQDSRNEDLEFFEKIHDEKSPTPSDNRLSDHFRSLCINDKPKPPRVQPLHLRNCTPCDCRGEREARKPRQRLTQSASVAARHIRRNGLPAKVNVPRPRTPYAKRSFCIDTLTPPFSIVNGCRDADYPEHWRLTSVYQQSYRNPVKQRGTILNWD